jgi:hypothetical protein
MIKIYRQPEETVEEAGKRTIKQVWAEIGGFADRDKIAVSNHPDLSKLSRVLVSGDGWALVDRVRKRKGVASNGITHTFFVEMVDGCVFEIVERETKLEWTKLYG